jgi:hypothetical protein
MILLKKRLGVSLLACAMAMGGMAPSLAAPIYAPAPDTGASNVVKVQLSREERRQIRKSYRQERRQDRREFRQERRQDRREARQERRFERRNGHYYYNGHRGYRTYHRGYREYNGYWFPPAAFVVGAIVGTAIASGGTRTVSSAHVQWCQNHYRSYRVSDDTFQPYNGPRERCYSPYD